MTDQELYREHINPYFLHMINVFSRRVNDDFTYYSAILTTVFRCDICVPYSLEDSSRIRHLTFLIRFVVIAPIPLLAIRTGFIGLVRVRRLSVAILKW